MSEAKTCDVCGSPVTQNEHGEIWHTRTDHAQNQLQAAVEAEREACADEARAIEENNKSRAYDCDEPMASSYFSKALTASTISEAIRDRGNTDALEAAKAEARAEALRVKSLEWDKYGEARCLGMAWAFCETRPSQYNVSRVAPDNERLGVGVSKKRAQNLAQADYERRILSALIPTNGEDG